MISARRIWRILLPVTMTATTLLAGGSAASAAPTSTPTASATADRLPESASNPPGSTKRSLATGVLPDTRGDLCRNLRARSINPIIRGRSLTQAGPQFQSVPELRRVGGRRLAVRVTVDYDVSNWKTNRRVRADRALAVFEVASEIFPTGATNGNPQYRKIVVDNKLAGANHCDGTKTYSVTLPRSVSAFLLKKGVMSNRSSTRREARRLIAVDVEQDRDHTYVDRKFDWRQGTAWSVGDTRQFRARRQVMRKRSSLSARSMSNPFGYLSITNETAVGVLPTRDSFLVQEDTGESGAVAGTSNQYSSDLIVVGSAYQCFDQNAGSNPAGFTNIQPNGLPGPYLAGEWVQGLSTQLPSETDTGAFPLTTGTTITQEIAADDTLKLLDNEQVADLSGGVIGSVQLGLGTGQYATTAAGLMDGFPSPGLIVSGAVRLVEYFIANSCESYPNLMSLTVLGPSGAAINELIEIDTEGMGAYNWACSPNMCSGTQIQPSSVSVEGTPLELWPFIGLSEGVCDTNNCDMAGAPGSNWIGLGWANYELCPTPAGVTQNPCQMAPPSSPVVTSNVNNVDCGANNAQCPFPAANWP